MKKSKENYEITMTDTRFTAELTDIPGSNNAKLVVRWGKYFATKLIPSGDMVAAQAASETLRRLILKNVRR